MPAYFLSNTLSDIASTRVLQPWFTTASTLVINLAAALGATSTASFITDIFYPNNNSVTTTSGTLVLVHTVLNMNINTSAQIHRVNSAGTIQSSGTAAANQVNAATNTFSALDEPTWSTVCSDRILVRITYTNTTTMTQSCTLGLDRLGTYWNSSIPHNGGTCPVLRKRHKVTTISKK